MPHPRNRSERRMQDRVALPLQRARTSTCTATGEPTVVPPSPPPPSTQYGIQTLGGLWAILVASAVAAVLIAQPTLAIMNDLVSRAYQRGRACCGLQPEPWKPETGMTQLGVIRELFRPAPPPPPRERLSSILEEVACVKALLEAQTEIIQEQRTATATASERAEMARAEQQTVQPASTTYEINVPARIIAQRGTRSADEYSDPNVDLRL